MRPPDKIVTSRAFMPLCAHRLVTPTTITTTTTSFTRENAWLDRLYCKADHMSAPRTAIVASQVAHRVRTTGSQVKYSRLAVLRMSSAATLHIGMTRYRNGTR